MFRERGGVADIGQFDRMYRRASGAAKRGRDQRGCAQLVQQQRIIAHGPRGFGRAAERNLRGKCGVGQEFHLPFCQRDGGGPDGIQLARNMNADVDREPIILRDLFRLCHLGIAHDPAICG